MSTGHVFNFVATECLPDEEAKFNKWYNETHIPMLLSFPGLLSVVRYKLAESTAGQAKYLAVYEFKDQATLNAFENSAELAAAREEMAQTWKGNFNLKWRAPYESLKSWKK
jgi:antibiotic biosynthesis monooxygenase (ABM) superfamily enzyme